MNLIYKLAIVSFVSLGLVGCKKDFLNTVPTSSTSPDVVFENLDNARMAVNGLARAMKRQYLESQGFNGEGTIKMWYGNYAGAHFSTPQPGWSSVTNLEYGANPQSTYTYYPWYYYYTIIGNANTLLKKIVDTPGPQNEKDFIVAQTLTFRAYCYTMLAQLYGDRWSDSNNGATMATVLRVTDDIGDVPLSSLSDTYALIYDDLNKAIGLYESSKINRPADKNYQANIDVAYAVYARAALNREDFPNAEKFAKLARANYPLMSKAEYNSGFATVNKEWIWSIFDNDQETIFFYSYASYIAYNSTAGSARTTPKSISKELYNTIPTTDIRKKLFLDPVTSGLTFASLTGQGNAAGLAYIRNLYPDIPSNSVAFSYMSFKFKATGMPGVSQLNNFRSSEMLLIEAEAKYKQNKSATEVQALMNELTKSTDRDPNYNCTATGTALFAEIQKYRSIELWGEGFDFFDQKRWGNTIVRKSFADGGNFQGSLAVTIKPTANNNWKLVTPARETDYSTVIK